MRVEETRDRDALERFFRRDAGAQIYGLADLDDAFWPELRAFVARGADGALAAVCLLLAKLEPPIAYAVAAPGDAAVRALLAALAPELPAVFFANFPLDASADFAATHRIVHPAAYLKMTLADEAALARAAELACEPLGPEHAAELREFYARDAYAEGERAGRFFAPYMLELAPWFGLREAGRLVSVAGVHVCSERYGVAALGNIATRPDRRGRGLARALTARLCRELLPRIPLIGLNVAADNTPAIRCYQALGFRAVLRYEEALFVRNGAAGSGHGGQRLLAAG